MGQNIFFTAKSRKDWVEQMHLELQYSPYLNDKYIQSDAVCENIKNTQSNNKKMILKKNTYE